MRPTAVVEGDESAREELGDVALAGLVNNAGIAVAAPLEFLPVDRLRQQLEINLIGQAAVTQAFLPALRRARGRIVTTAAERRGPAEGSKRSVVVARPGLGGASRDCAARRSRPSTAS